MDATEAWEKFLEDRGIGAASADNTLIAAFFFAYAEGMKAGTKDTMAIYDRLLAPKPVSHFEPRGDGYVPVAAKSS